MQILFCYNRVIKREENKDMTKTFIYKVAGYEFRDTEAFGQAWREAKAKATELHCGIFREVEKDGAETRYEFYATYGAFVNMKFYDDSKLAIF
jgi:hypothetical protein